MRPQNVALTALVLASQPVPTTLARQGDLRLADGARTTCEQKGAGGVLRGCGRPIPPGRAGRLCEKCRAAPAPLVAFQSQ